MLIKRTNPNLSVIRCYLDVESRKDNSTIEKVWTKVVSKVETAIGRGEGVVLLGDLNRPLQTLRPSFGTKLLLDWENTGTVFILNKKEIPTRIDPVTGKGSTLDLGVVSANINKLVTNFEVDTNRNWSPFAIKTKPGGTFEKKFSDHLGITIVIKTKKREIINFKNEEG